MRTYEEMQNLAVSLYEHEEKEGDNGTDSVTFKVGDKEISPRVHVEPEDAIWRRDLSSIFDDGETLGMRAMYEAFKVVLGEGDVKPVAETETTHTGEGSEEFTAANTDGTKAAEEAA